MSNFTYSKNKICLISVIAGIVLYTIVFTALYSLRYQTFFSYEWEDEAAENQLLWNTAHGNFLKQTIFQREFFIDHFSPIHILIAPFYRLFPRIYTFHFILTLGLGIGALPIYFLSNTLLKNSFKSALLSFIYLFYPPLHWVNLSVVEPVMLSVPFLLFAFYFFFRQKLKFFIIFIVLSLMCKENIALIVIAMGILFALNRYNLKYSMMLIAIGLIWFLVSFYWIIPHFGRETRHVLCAWARQTIPDTVKFIVLQPLEAFKYMFNPEKAVFFVKILAPLLFLPLFSVKFYIAMPIFLQILLFESPIRLEAYYLSAVIPCIFVGMLFVLQKIDNYLRARLHVKAEAVVALLVITLSFCVWKDVTGNNYGSFDNEYINDKKFIGVKSIYDKRFYIKDDSDRIAWKMIEMVPDDASVSATGDLLVPLSHREKILEFAFDDLDDGGGYNYFDVDYIAINRKNQYFGAGRYAFPEKKHFRKLDKLIEEGMFDILYEEKSFLLLKRGDLDSNNCDLP